MSVKIAAYKKPSPAQDYACSVIEAKEWAEDFADLRIEFGSQKKFQMPARCDLQKKFRGQVIVSIAIDCQLKPSLLFYPVEISQYTDPVQKEFREKVLGELKQWLNEKLSRKASEVIGHDMVLVELAGGKLNTHFLRYL